MLFSISILLIYSLLDQLLLLQCFTEPNEEQSEELTLC